MYTNITNSNMIFIVSLFCESNFPSWHFCLYDWIKVSTTHHTNILPPSPQSTFHPPSFFSFIAANNFHIFILYIEFCHTYAEVDTRNMFLCFYLHAKHLRYVAYKIIEQHLLLSINFSVLHMNEFAFIYEVN